MSDYRGLIDEMEDTHQPPPSPTSPYYDSMEEWKQRVAKANPNIPSSTETVNHPAHYNQGTMEVIDAIDGLQLGFCAGNVLKYIARYKAKGGIEDLKKARWYLDHLIKTESEGTK